MRLKPYWKAYSKTLSETFLLSGAIKTKRNFQGACITVCEENKAGTVFFNTSETHN